jgi:hypothetical protein
MDPNTLITFGIPSITLGVMVYRRFFKSAAKASEITALASGKIAQDAAAATDDASLATRAWLDYVNGQPDTVPHLVVIGPSGSGKTTTTKAVLHDRTGQIVVLTAKEGDDWGGLPYIGIDDDATYTTASNTFDQLLAEVKQRLIAAKHKRLTADWLTIVLDDFSTLAKECEDAPELVKLVARLGRSLRVRLIMLTDTALVKAIGLEGEGETRGNFAFLRLKRGHTATLEIDAKPIPIDTSLVARVAAAVQFARRAWKPVREPGDELAELLAIRPSVQKGQNRPEMTRTERTDETDGTDGRADEAANPRRDGVIRHMVAQGADREEIRAMVKAAGWRISNARLSALMREDD